MASAFFRYGTISKVAANDAEREKIVSIHFSKDSDWVEKTITDSEVSALTYSKLKLELDSSNELVKTTISYGLEEGEDRLYATGEILREIIDQTKDQITRYLQSNPNDNFGWSTYLEELEKVKVSGLETGDSDSIMINFNTDKNIEEQLSDAGVTSVKSLLRLP